MSYEISCSKQMYTLDDLEQSISAIHSHATIHYAEKEELSDDEVINHMPYNSGKFFIKTNSDNSFFNKSISNDISFSIEIFG